MNESPARSRALFDAALSQPRHARSDFLRQACSDDPSMLRDVMELVELHDRLESAEDHEGGLIGTMVGPYRIVRLLGEGGMGSVYLAARADGAFERDVAIKVVNPRAVEEDVMQRLEDECRILASLKHPNIAALLDAGRTIDGRLYFVMEYVDGLPITQYCERTDLPFRERLLMLRQVCDAVAFAHRNLIVHRDLKPGNILVDGGRTPKLLDFGIAKALTRAGLEASDPTLPHLKRATVGYASPEQLRGDAAHTGMDVFALGVILYELVSGTQPVKLSADAPTTTRPSEYQAPSSLVDELAGKHRRPGATARDIDAVALRALAANPKHRYASAEALGRDLEAILGNRPVTARPPTVLDRTAKCVRRNPALVALAATMVLAIIAAIASLSYLWQLERRERTAAVRRFDELQKLAVTLFDADTALAAVPGTTAAREALSRSLAEYLNALRASARTDRRILLHVAESYRRLGDVQGNPNGSHLGDSSSALGSYSAAVDILRDLSSDDPSSTTVATLLAETLASRGDVHSVGGASREAASAYAEAAQVARRLLDTRADEATHSELLARIHRSVGDLALLGGDAAAAAASYDQALAIELSLTRRLGQTSDRRRLLALTRLRTAAAREQQGDWREAHAQYAAAVEVLRAVNTAERPAAAVMRDTAVGLTRLGSMVRATDPDAAGNHLREGIELFRRLAAADAGDVRVRRDLYLALVQYGDLLLPTDGETARSQYEQARVLAESLGSDRDSRVESDLAMIRERLASGPAAIRPQLRLFAVSAGQRVPLGPARTIPPSANSFVAAAEVPPGWSRYLVVFGAEGPGKVLDEQQLAQTRWTLPLTGPPPSQTVLLLTLRRKLTQVERDALAESIGAIPGPRAVDWDSQVVWTSEESEPQILSTASARGQRDTRWVGAVQSCLTRVPGARFTGLTFPIASPRR